jgi:hypothetical protein
VRVIGSELRCFLIGDWRYLTRHAVEGVSPAHEDDVAATRDGARDYYTTGEEHGEPAGVWWGRGAASLGQTGEVTESVMERPYGDLVDPRTGEALGTRPRTYMTFDERLAALLAKEPEATPERQAELALAAHKSHREARHYANLTFSPPKSWSVLHAALEHAGRHEEAQAVWDSWIVGVQAGLEYLMDEAGYSRAGDHRSPVARRTTGRWVDAHDWVISIWRHHTSRDGDPQLHVHAAVVNRVRCPDGVWRSLDSLLSDRMGDAAPAALGSGTPGPGTG